MVSRLTRISAFFLLAIVVPAAIVAVLGWVSLRQWSASAELLFREQSRDMATMTVDKMQMLLRHAEDEALGRLQATIETDGASEASLDAFRAATPLVDRLYLLDRRGQVLYPRTWAPADAAVLAALLAEVSQGFWERGGRRDFTAGETVVLAAILKSRTGEPVLAAMARNVDAMRTEIFEKTIKPLDAPLVCAVIDAHGRAVYARQPVAGAALVVSAPFREALPGWRLALYQPPGTSPRARLQRMVALFTTAFGVLLVVIAVGAVATWRLVRHETEMARLKSDFVANVSHDLKTPLSVIRMFGETLEMGRVPDEARRREYYAVITRESERLSRLIDNVLDFSRIEGGRRRYDLAPAAVEPLVRETVDAFGYPFAQQGFKVEVMVARDLPEVAIDRDAVGQALANLVDNAIKYSAERKVVSVEAAIVDGRLALSVTDEGVGIPPEEQARIFEKFYRVGRSDTQGRRGSGVGLALVRHVAEAHGGRVTVESRAGQGSRFTIWLPLDARESGRDRAVSRTRSASEEPR